MKRFLDAKEDWGQFIYVKMNCPELLKKELQDIKLNFLKILVSSKEKNIPFSGKLKE